MSTSPLSDGLSAVKLLRIGLLVMLAVLLPLRGAVAATMLCGPAGTGGHGAQVHDGSGEAHAAPAHGHSQHDHGKGGHPGHDPASPDKCNLCSATCSSPPLASASTGIAEPQILSLLLFPGLCAPAPTFQSDGQERPPRTT